MEATATGQRGAGRRKAWLGGWPIGRHRVLHEAQCERGVALRPNCYFEPVGAALAQRNTVVRLQLGPAGADDGFGEPHVERAVVIEVGHLAGPNPDCRPRAERTFAERRAVKRGTSLDEFELHGRDDATYGDAAGSDD